MTTPTPTFPARSPAAWDAPLPPEVILWGGTGQAKVVRPIVTARGSTVSAVFSDVELPAPPFDDVPLLVGRDAFLRWVAERPGCPIGFSVTIGNPHGRVRLKLHDFLVAHGLTPVTVVHPAAFIEVNATLGEGCQVMAGAVIGAEARLGRQVIVNTRASVDHEDVLEDGSEVAPGATLCGLVRLCVNAWVCAGATVLPRLTIGEDAIVGAGALVNRDVPPGVTVVGVPARVRRKG